MTATLIRWRPPTEAVAPHRRHAAAAPERVARGTLLQILTASIIGILAWGTFVFGAVYPWAYWPLAISCAAVGLTGMLTSLRNVRIPVAIALVLLVAAVVVQLIPVSAALRERVSPGLDGLLARYDLTFVAARQPPTDPSRPHMIRPNHPLTLDPRQTWIGLALLGALSVFLLGVSAQLDERMAQRLAEAVIAIGFLAAIVAIVLSPSDNGKVYGFWQPQSQMAVPYGPFVNRNHFAGWMLMALPLGFGYFIGRMTAVAAQLKSTWRARVMWLSTPAASVLILIGGALTVMAISVLMSLSRSGVSCLGVSGLMLACLVARKLGRLQRSIVILYLILTTAICVGWAAGDRLAARFDEFQNQGNTRSGIWQDAWNVARRYPLVGTGLNTFGASMLFYQTQDLAEHDAEAHSDYLQLAAEGGLLLTVPAALLLLVIVLEVRRRFAERQDDQAGYWIRVGAVAGLLAIALQEAAEFSLQLPGTAALCAVLVAIAIHRPARAHRIALRHR